MSRKYPAEIATLVIRTRSAGGVNFAICGKKSAYRVRSMEDAVRACAVKSARSLVKRGIIAPIEESEMEFVEDSTFWHVHVGPILERRPA